MREAMNLEFTKSKPWPEPFGKPSMHVLKASGFQEDKLLRGHYLRDEIYEDSLIFSLH